MPARWGQSPIGSEAELRLRGDGEIVVDEVVP
jgi:hypothetical protein